MESGQIISIDDVNPKRKISFGNSKSPHMESDSVKIGYSRRLGLSRVSSGGLRSSFTLVRWRTLSGKPEFEDGVFELGDEHTPALK